MATPSLASPSASHPSSRPLATPSSYHTISQKDTSTPNTKHINVSKSHITQLPIALVTLTSIYLSYQYRHQIVQYIKKLIQRTSNSSESSITPSTHLPNLLSLSQYALTSPPPIIDDGTTTTSHDTSTPTPPSLHLHKCIQVSAPGKVLISGGYLILERPNAGLVCSVDAKFHSIIRSLSYEELANYVVKQHVKQHSATPFTLLHHSVPIIVYTPQRSLNNQPTVYEVIFNGPSYRESDIYIHTLTTESEYNPFVVNSILYTLYVITSLLDDRILHDKLQNGLVIYLYGDYQFYTAQPPDTSLKMQRNERLDGKTGLGSSAALTSALIASLFAHFHLIDIDDNYDDDEREIDVILLSPIRCDKHTDSQSANGFHGVIHFTPPEMYTLCHHVSQFVHCLSQGKVGSGFDIAAAFYGSQRYVRYSTQVLKPIIKYVSSLQQQRLGSNNRGEVAYAIDRLYLLSQLLPNDIAVLRMPPHTTDQANAPHNIRTPTEPVAQSSPSCCLSCCYTSRRDWDYSIRHMSLPPSLTLILADVQGGASTPSMVTKVLKWRNTLHINNNVDGSDTSNENDSAHGNAWDELAAYNKRFENLLQTLHALHTSNCEVYMSMMRHLSQSSSHEWDIIFEGSKTYEDHELHRQIIDTLTNLRSTFFHIRHLLRTIGQLSNVEIESKQQEQLCDATMNVAGVLCSGVPGAGGEDAIFAILLANDADVIGNVEKVWEHCSVSSNRSIRRLHVTENKSGLSSGILDDFQVG